LRGSWLSDHLRQIGGFVEAKCAAETFIDITRFASSTRCSENQVPQLCCDTIVAVRKPVMVEVMFQQGSRENRRMVMGAVVDE
jgi:hypothetical protein